MDWCSGPVIYRCRSIYLQELKVLNKCIIIWKVYNIQFIYLYNCFLILLISVTFSSLTKG